MTKNEKKEEISKQTLMLRVQKKLASGLVNKTTLKGFMSEMHFNMLENLYSLLKAEGDKKEAKKVIKFIIKIMAKLIILQRNNQLSEGEINKLTDFSLKMKNIVSTSVTFWEIEGAYDFEFINAEFGNCYKIMLDIAKKHLTAKSQARISFLFNYVQNKDRLDRIFIAATPEIKEQSEKVRKDFQELLQNKLI